jgi:WD40 repeat protein
VIVKKKGEPLRQVLRHKNTVYSVCFSRNGRRILTTSADWTARVWDTATGEPITPPLRHVGKVYSGTFSDDGRLVATCSDDNTARVWDASTGEPVTSPLSHDGTVHRVVFRADGRALLTASLDGTARVWDVTTAEALTPPLKITGWVKQVLAGGEAAVSWDLPEEKRSLEHLRLLARTFSGRRIDNGGLIALDIDELQQAWQTLRTRYPEEFARCPR